MRGAWLIAVFIVLLPAAMALDVSELNFYSHGEPLGVVSMGTIPNIDIELVVTQGSEEEISHLQSVFSEKEKDQDNCIDQCYCFFDIGWICDFACYESQ